MLAQDLAGRRIAIWGFGREGRSTFAFLRREAPGLDVTVVNDKPLSATDLLDGVPTLIDASPALDAFDVVVKSPGISLYRPEIERAKDRGTEFTSATRLWFAYGRPRQALTVAVTGTKGKSTTSSLIAHLLRASGVRAELRGNIGRPVLDPAPDAVDVWVLELSSYQTADLCAPTDVVDVAVLLNLYPEHLDWHGDEATYYRDKIRLLEQQARHGWGTSVFDHALAEDPRLVGKTGKARLFNEPASGPPEAFERAFPLRGEHNLSNLRAAWCAVDELGIALGDESPANFRGLPHRQEILGTYGGLLWVDDSISTTPQSTQAAVDSFPDQPVTVLLGGYDRGIDYRELARFLAARPRVSVVTLGASGSRIARALKAETVAARECADLPTAVAAAREATPPGGVVLLSPAAPSYDQFKNFEARGDAFRRLAQDP